MSLVEITAKNSVSNGKVGWLLEDKRDAMPYHDAQTYNSWDAFIFIADSYVTEDGKPIYYGATVGFNHDEYRIIK
jgi:hypothetical protein